MKKFEVTVNDLDFIDNWSHVLPSHKRNILDDEWFAMCDKLALIRLQVNEQDEKAIRDILKKY